MPNERVSPDTNRRQFCQLLGAAPVAAAVAFGLGDTALLAATPAAGSAAAQAPSTGASFTLVKSSEIEGGLSALATAPGNKLLVAPKGGLPFTVMLTVENKKSAAEFEWHEGRDHVFQVLDGSTRVELGGKPTGAHQTKPGEWLATGSDGATTVTLNKGDVLCIAQGTPHKRSTDEHVVLQLVSIEVPAKG